MTQMLVGDMTTVSTSASGRFFSNSELYSTAAPHSNSLRDFQEFTSLVDHSIVTASTSVHQNPYLVYNPFVAKNLVLYFRARLIRIGF